MQDREIARSITEIFLASKIIKAIENSIARKESMIIDVDLVSLEDYLFEDENKNKKSIDYFLFKNIKIVNSEGRILNLSGSLFITEAEVLMLANGVTVRAPSVNIESANEVASSFMSMPTSIDVTGILSNVKDITIEKVGSVYNVIDTQTHETIATVKTSVIPALKEFAASIIATIKSMFGVMAQDPLPFVIGLLGGVIVFPILKKVIGLFRRKKQSNENTNEENYYIDEFDDIVYEKNESSRLRGLFEKVMTVLKTIYRKATTFIKAIIGFMIGVFRNAKDIAQRSLDAIRKMYITTSYKFTQYVLYVVEVIIKYVKLAIAKVKDISKAVYTKTTQKMKEIARILNNTLQNAIQKIRNQFRKNEDDVDLQKYLDAIAADLEKLQDNLKIIFSKDFISDEGKKALSEIAKTAEDTFKHIFELLIAFLKKIKNKAKEVIQRLIDKITKVLQTIGDIFYSFIKALGEFAKRIKAKIIEWVDKVRNAISNNPAYQKVTQQLANIRNRIR